MAARRGPEKGVPVSRVFIFFIFFQRTKIGFQRTKIGFQRTKIVFQRTNPRFKEPIALGDLCALFLWLGFSGG